MGAWGTSTFANDDAMDWVPELQAEGLIAAGGAIQAVLDLAPDYLEAPVCATALAAAEVIASLRGQPAADLPDEIVAWIATYSEAPGGELTENARRAVDLILADSELLELWAESPDHAAWRAAVEDVRARLV